MIIAVDTHAAEREGEGNCTYIRNLLLALAQIEGAGSSKAFPQSTHHQYRSQPANRYILYTINSSHPFYEQFAAHPNFTLKSLRFNSPFIRIPFALALRTLLDRPDVLHVQYIAPPLFSGRLVTSIHDLGFLHHPETFPPFMTLRSRLLMRRTAHRSAVIITGSRFSFEDIAATYQIKEDKIRVIPYGVSPKFQPDLPWDKTQQVLNRYGLRPPYIISVGRLNPRKNFASLIRALALLKKEHHLPHLLVIVGKKDYRSDELFRLVAKLGLEKEVIFPGLVDENDLPYLYRAADLFVFPSFFEGFGLPVLEAMRSGLPVVTSNSSSLAEIAGDAALQVNPNETHELAQAILKAVTNQALRKTLVERGLSRVNQFTWENAARQTLAVYRRVANMR